MKYFIDTEFKEKPNTIDLISIGIVSEDGNEYYAICRDFLPKLKQIWKDEWIRKNVLLPIYMENINIDLNVGINFSEANFNSLIHGVSKPSGQIRREIVDFIDDDKPEFYGYYADYDWVVFCWIFGRMIDLPQKFPMYCRDLKQIYDEKAEYLNFHSKNRNTEPFLKLMDGSTITFKEIWDKDWKKELKNLGNYPKQKNEHNALSDAKWNYELYKFLESIK